MSKISNTSLAKHLEDSPSPLPMTEKTTIHSPSPFDESQTLLQISKKH